MLMVIGALIKYRQISGPIGPKTPEHRIEKLWIDEAIRRDEELDSVTGRAYPADEVLARARARGTSR